MAIIEVTFFAVVLALMFLPIMMVWENNRLKNLFVVVFISFYAIFVFSLGFDVIELFGKPIDHKYMHANEKWRLLSVSDMGNKIYFTIRYNKNSEYRYYYIENPTNEQRKQFGKQAHANQQGIPIEGVKAHRIQDYNIKTNDKKLQYRFEHKKPIQKDLTEQN